MTCDDWRERQLSEGVTRRYVRVTTVAQWKRSRNLVTVAQLDLRGYCKEIHPQVSAAIVGPGLLGPGKVPHLEFVEF